MAHISVISWTDSNVEINSFQEILDFKKYPKNNRILIPVSSGETALSLFSFPSETIRSITCVGSSSRTLAALELKTQILLNIPSPEERVAFLQGQLYWQTIIRLFLKLSPLLKSTIYWNNHQNDLVRGLNSHDHWLSLFRKYQEIIIKSPDLSEFEISRQVFSNSNMIKSGALALIENGLKIPISSLIYSSLNQHKMDLNNGKENPFSSLMLHGFYSSGIYPPYLKVDAKNVINKKLKLINNNFWNYLENTKKYFSMISCGNLTDFLTIDHLKYYLPLIRSKLLLHGRVIFRRMSNDTPLREYINHYFKILDIDRDFLQDQTHLYREIILACPRR